MPATRHNRPGFTLIELIVVISIIALLMALLLPSLSKTRARSQAVVCGTRVKALGTALATYLASWDDTVPINGLVMPKPFIPTMYQGNTRYTDWVASYPDQWRIEFGALWPYMGGTPMPPGVNSYKDVTTTPLLPLTNATIAKAYICPTDGAGWPANASMIRTFAGNGDTQVLWLDTTNPLAPKVMSGLGGANAASPGYWSYSVNSVLNSLGRFRNRFFADSLPWADPIKMFNIKSPHDFITFIEEDNASLFNDEVVDAPAYSQGDMLTNRHNGGGNVGFADGHVELFNQVVFDQVPSAISGNNVSHTDAMGSEITRKFFPDRGDFANP